jgi:hypothetical protein
LENCRLEYRRIFHEFETICSKDLQKTSKTKIYTQFKSRAIASIENIVYSKNKVLELFEAYPNMEILTLIVRDLAKLLKGNFEGKSIDGSRVRRGLEG